MIGVTDRSTKSLIEQRKEQEGKLKFWEEESCMKDQLIESMREEMMIQQQEKERLAMQNQSMMMIMMQAEAKEEVQREAEEREEELNSTIAQLKRTEEARGVLVAVVGLGGGRLVDRRRLTAEEILSERVEPPAEAVGTLNSLTSTAKLTISF